jgi:uncharacterized membrane protein
MRRWGPWIAAALVAAVAVHLLAVRAIPWVLMRIAMNRIGALSGINTPGFAPRADENARTIVRPSPDLIYSTCVFDVADGPLRITAEIPRDTYWSLSMFAANTDNFFKLNDREAKGGRVDVVLAKQGAAVAAPPGTLVVETPTFRGIVLTRTLVDDDARLAELDAARRSFTCAPMRSNDSP